MAKKPKAAPSKPRRQTSRAPAPHASPAKAAAARSNGRKGGRPRDDRYAQIFAELGEPPDDPLALATWAQRVLARLLFETGSGRGNRGLNGEARAFANGIARLLPAERVYQAEKAIRAAAQPKRPAPRKGPPLEDIAPLPEGRQAMRL